MLAAVIYRASKLMLLQRFIDMPYEKCLRGHNFTSCSTIVFVVYFRYKIAIQRTFQKFRILFPLSSDQTDTVVEDEIVVTQEHRAEMESTEREIKAIHAKELGQIISINS